MPRLIDANALIQQFSAGETMKTMTQNVYDTMFVKALREAPTVDAVEVVHGRWIEYQIPHIMCCSECDWGTGVQSDFRYCPHCGAKMDGDGND